MSQFTTRAGDLAQAASVAATVIPGNPAPAILGGIRIASTDTGVSLSGYDYETALVANLACETVDGGIDVVASGRLLAAITKTLTASAMVTVAVENAALAITFGSSRITLPLMTTEDFPRLPTPNVGGVMVDCADLADAIGRVAPVVGSGEIAPALTGVHFSSDGSDLTLWATDRFCMIRSAIADVGHPECDATIPAGPLQRIASALGDAGQARLSMSGKNVTIATAALVMTTRAFAETWPMDAVWKLFEKDFTPRALVEVKPLTEILRRAATLTDKKIPHVNLDVLDGAVRIAGVDELGSVDEGVTATDIGDDWGMRFNVGYLSRLLSSIGGSAFAMSSADPRMMRLVNPENPSTTAILMGVKR